MAFRKDSVHQRSFWNLLRAGVVGLIILPFSALLALSQSPVIREPSIANDSHHEIVREEPRPVSEAVDANVIAARAHTLASTVDLLTRFYVTGRAIACRDSGNATSTADRIQGMKQAIEMPVDQQNSKRYFPVFARDGEHYVVGMQNADTYNPKFSEVADLKLFGTFNWGAKEASGITGINGEPLNQKRTMYHSFSDANEAWNRAHVFFPGYLLVTNHRYWWGENSYSNHRISGSGIPINRGNYRIIGEEVWDNESCYVVASRIRMEQLWVSKKTGLMLGLVSFTANPPKDYFKSPYVKEATGLEFSTEQEWNNWRDASYRDLSAENRIKLESGFYLTLQENQLLPIHMIRFRDYREIARNVWWPFHEDSIEGISRTTFDVDELRTDLDLKSAIDAFKPPSDK